MGLCFSAFDCCLNIFRNIFVDKVLREECSLRLRVYKRVVISLYQQWLMNRQKTKVNNIFEEGKVYCERLDVIFNSFQHLTLLLHKSYALQNHVMSLGRLW